MILWQISFYPLSKSLSVRCTIYPRRAGRVICQLARPRIVADRAFLLQISSHVASLCPNALDRCHAFLADDLRKLSPRTNAFHISSARFPFCSTSAQLRDVRFCTRAFIRARFPFARLAHNFTTFDSTRARFPVARSLDEQLRDVRFYARLYPRARRRWTRWRRRVASRQSENFTPVRDTPSLDVQTCATNDARFPRSLSAVWTTIVKSMFKVRQHWLYTPRYQDALSPR